MIKLQNECTQCGIVVGKINMVIIQVYKHDSIQDYAISDIIRCVNFDKSDRI